MAIGDDAVVAVAGDRRGGMIAVATPTVTIATSTIAAVSSRLRRRVVPTIEDDYEDSASPFR